MKNILFAALIFFSGNLLAQKQQFEYLQVTYIDGGFNSKTTAIYDDGSQVIRAFAEALVLKDSTGNETFKSPTHLFNYLGAQGWEIIHLESSKESGTLRKTLLLKRLKG